MSKGETMIFELLSYIYTHPFAPKFGYNFAIYFEISYQNMNGCVLMIQKTFAYSRLLLTVFRIFAMKML